MLRYFALYFIYSIVMNVPLGLTCALAITLIYYISISPLDRYIFDIDPNNRSDVDLNNDHAVDPNNRSDVDLNNDHDEYND